MISFSIYNSAEEMFEPTNELEELIKGYQKCADKTLQGNIANFEDFDQERYSHFYRKLEEKGSVFIYVIMKDEDKTIGTLILEVEAQPHYGYKVVFINSIYLLPKYRRFNYGRKLIEFGQKLAKKKGAKGMYFTAPAGSRLERVYNRLYVKTDTIFFKEL